MKYSEGQINMYFNGIQNGRHFGKRSLLEINNGITSALRSS